MAKEKLYQFLQGEDRGKIVKLVGIENEDNVTYLKFDNGSRCNIDFAAGLNDARAYNDGKFVAEVIDTKNVWTFEDKSIKDDVRYGTLKDTGQVVEGWDPYTHGQFGNENKAKRAVKAIPPRHVITKDELKSGEEKLRELGIDRNTPGYEEGMKSITMPTQDSLLEKLNIQGKTVRNNFGGNYENVERNGTTMNLDPTGVQPPSEKDLEQFKRATEIYIPEDIEEKEDKENETSSVSLNKNIESKVDNIMVQRNTLMQQLEEPKKEIKKHTDSPIYSIVSKCKKKDVSAPLILNLKLPGKSIYNLIKEEYEDEALDEFFDIILDEISVDEIKASLKEALKQSYEPMESSSND